VDEGGISTDHSKRGIVKKMKDGDKGFGAKSGRQLISQGHSGNISFGNFATQALFGL
jgi:hypothetical protein